jgi:hypothetical protein
MISRPCQCLSLQYLSILQDFKEQREQPHGGHESHWRMRPGANAVDAASNAPTPSQLFYRIQCEPSETPYRKGILNSHKAGPHSTGSLRLRADPASLVLFDEAAMLWASTDVALLPKFLSIIAHIFGFQDVCAVGTFL